MQWLIDLILESMKGIILLWSGAIVDIPDGWHLCDGTEGTPDLRDRFIAGAGTTYNPDDTGGSPTHTHPFTGDGHSHTIPAGAQVAAGAFYADSTADAAAVGTTNATDHKPPYYALCYIQKI